MSALVGITRDTPVGEAVTCVLRWVDEHVPVAWRDAAGEGGVNRVGGGSGTVG